MPMLIRSPKFRWLFVFAALSFVGCKPGIFEKKKAGADSGRSLAADTAAEPGFTSAEIRRDKPVEIDTAGLVPAATTLAVSAPKNGPTPIVKPQSTAAAPPVSVQAAKPVPAPAASVPAPAIESAVPAAGAPAPGESGDWVLQVNVHRSEDDAKAQIAKLGQQGIPAYAIPVPTGDATLSGNYWRVRVGRFQSRAEAQGFGKSVLEPKGLKFWVDKKTNEAKQGT